MYWSFTERAFYLQNKNILWQNLLTFYCHGWLLRMLSLPMMHRFAEISNIGIWLHFFRLKNVYLKIHIHFLLVFESPGSSKTSFSLFEFNENLFERGKIRHERWLTNRWISADKRFIFELHSLRNKISKFLRSFKNFLCV